jgi:SRSO17 transposase
MTKRREVTPAAGLLETYCQEFDQYLVRWNQHEGIRRYLEGLLLPAERNKTLTGLANTTPGTGAQEARAQSLQWFLSESTWDESAVNARRCQLLRQTAATAPHTDGVLVIDETGDLKDGTHTAHVGRQYLGNVGKIGNGVVSVSSLWADEQIYYPLDVIPYTPAGWFEDGKKDPSFRTKLTIAVDLVQQAVAQRWPFKAVVADSFYGEDGSFRESLHRLSVGFVMALKPSHSWWHQQGKPGSLKAVAYATAKRKWQKVERTFRDGHRENGWALEIQVGPYGPKRSERAIVVTTDPATLPELSTWYLVTNLRLGNNHKTTHSRLPSASLTEVVRLYGLRNWVEQSYKQVKTTLGWAHYQVRSSRAIIRHWTLVYCAFTFCWWQVTQQTSDRSSVSPIIGDIALQPSASLRQSKQTAREKKSCRRKTSTYMLMAHGAPHGSKLVGTSDHAQTLLAHLLVSAPALRPATAIRLARTW